MDKLLHERLREHADLGCLSFVGNGYDVSLYSEEARALADEIESYYIPRPQPKVYDADGIEIKVGENRYSIKTGEYLVVNKVGTEYCLCTVLGDMCTLGTCGYKPSELSSKEPDSLEKLYDDMARFRARTPFVSAEIEKTVDKFLDRFYDLIKKEIG